MHPECMLTALVLTIITVQPYVASQWEIFHFVTIALGYEIDQKVVVTKSQITGTEQ